MEIENYTVCTDENIERLSFSRYVKSSSLVDLLNGKIFIPSFDIVRKADPQELGIPAYSYAFLEREFFNHSNFEQEQSWLEQKWEQLIGTAFRDVGEVREKMLKPGSLKQKQGVPVVWLFEEATVAIAHFLRFGQIPSAD